MDMSSGDDIWAGIEASEPTADDFTDGAVLPPPNLWVAGWAFFPDGTVIDPDGVEHPPISA
jgi:hypothetical protein